MSVALDVASLSELEFLEVFLHDNGANEWNHLPKEGVHDTFNLIKEGCGEIVCARNELSKHVIGIGIYFYSSSLPSTFTKYANGKRACFVAEMCVHKSHTGKGVGSQILKNIAMRVADQNLADIILMDRHEDNEASGGMMRKAGCTVLDSFDDHMKRPTGSRRTVVLEMNI